MICILHIPLHTKAVIFIKNESPEMSMDLEINPEIFPQNHKKRNMV
jgi:hypothetical protein